MEDIWYSMGRMLEAGGEYMADNVNKPNLLLYKMRGWEVPPSKPLYGLPWLRARRDIRKHEDGGIIKKPVTPLPLP